MSKEGLINKLKYGTKYWDAGAKEPYPNMSKASLARMMEATIKTHSKIHDFHALDSGYSRSIVLYRLEIPIGMESVFEEIAKVKLTEIPKVQIN